MCYELSIHIMNIVYIMPWMLCYRYLWLTQWIIDIIIYVTCVNCLATIYQQLPKSSYRCRLSSRRMLLRVRINRNAPLPRELARFSPFSKVDNRWSGCKPFCTPSSISVARWIRAASGAYAQIVLPWTTILTAPRNSLHRVRTAACERAFAIRRPLVVARRCVAAFNL